MRQDPTTATGTARLDTSRTEGGPVRPGPVVQGRASGPAPADLPHLPAPSLSFGHTGEVPTPDPRTPRFLVSAALIVSHSSALGALEGCTFGADHLSVWGDPSRFSAHLMGIYDDSRAAALLGILRDAWQGSHEAQHGPFFFGALGSVQDAQDATTYPGCGFVVCCPGAGPVELFGDDLVMNETLGRLITLARDWLAAFPMHDGLRQWPVNNVARCAEFAWLQLVALGGAAPGETLDLPGMPGTQEKVLAERACITRHRAALSLQRSAAYLAQSGQERQRLCELLLLMPTFLAAMYEHGRLLADLDTQEMVTELANDYLQEFFGEPPLRSDFGAPRHMTLDPL